MTEREPLMAAAERLYREDARFYALVHLVAKGIADGTFTAAELLAAVPLAQRLAMHEKVLEVLRPGEPVVFYGGLRGADQNPRRDKET